MNRKKKINQTLKHKAKKANAKLQTTRKPQYIAKAVREAQAATMIADTVTADTVAADIGTVDMGTVDMVTAAIQTEPESGLAAQP